MARPGDWSPLGLHGDPTPGDLDILQSLHTEFQGLGDLAGEVNSGLDRVLNQSADGFIGKTAEAVRKKIDGHLKKFIASVGHSFSVSGPATLDYLNAVRDAQAKADQALASAQGLSQDDPQLVSLKAQVHDAQDQYNAAAYSYADKLWNAGKIEQPISGWQLFLQALGILAIILAVLGAIFGGWVGLIALAVNAALLIKTAVEFAEGKASLLDLGLAVIGVLFPSTKGLNIGQLSKGLFNALKNLPKMAAGGLTNIGKGITHFFTEGLTFKSVYNGVANLPGLVLRGLTGIGSLALKGAKISIGALKLIGSTFKNDFHLATIGTTTTLGKIGVYAMSFGSRFLVSATLPLDFFELGVGARAAIKMGLGTRLTTPWAHLSQPIVGGGLHVGALAGGHFSFHAANGTTGFGGLNHSALGGLNGSALPGLRSTGTAGLGGLHGLNTGVDVGGLHGLNTGVNVGGLHGLNTGVNVGGLHGLDTVGTVHLGAGITPDTLGHALAGVGGDASAVEHLTAIDHATGFDRTASGLLEPMGSHFSAGHVGTTHLGSMNLSTGSATSHLGVSGVHNLRTDLTGSATGLHTAISDSMSGVRGAAGHAADFHAIGISELKSIADGDISGLRVTPDGVSMHIGAQSGTPTALHMNFRTMSLTDGAGHQVVVAPEAHTALGTTDVATPAPVHTGSAAPTPVHGTASATPAPVHAAPPASASVKDAASTPLTDVKAPATTHGAPPPSSSAAVKTDGAIRNLDELSGGAKSFDQQGRFAEGPAEHAVTAQNGHLGVSAHDQLDLSGRREGTGDTAGAAAPTVHESEAVAGALSATPIAVRPGPARSGTDIASGGGFGATAGEHIAVRPAPRPHTGPGGVTRPPKSRFEAITGGVGGRIGAERMSAWNHYEKGVGEAVRAEDALRELGGGLDKPSKTVDQAAAKLDAQQAGLGVDAARQDLARLGMDVDTVQARLDQLVAPKTHPGTELGGDLATAGTHDAAAGTHDVSVATHDAAAADGHGAGADASLSKLEELRAPAHTPEKSPIESAPKAPADAPSSGLSKTADWYVDRLDGIAKDAGMSRADRSLYKQAIDDAVRADDFHGVAHNYAQFRDHVELTTLNHRYDAFRTHIDQGFDRLGDLGVDRTAWQAKVDAVHDARAAHDLDLQNAALRDYTAFVERHMPSEVLTGKDVPKAFDANLRRVLGDLATAGGPGQYVRLRQELGDLLEMNGFQERLDALRGELGGEEAALHARIGSSATPDEGASAIQALHDFRADQDLAARLDALKSDTSGASHAVGDGSPPGLQERLDALRGAATDPHEIELQRLFDEAVGGDDQARALQDLHDYREERGFQARLDALRHDDGAEHLDTSAGESHVSGEELADRFASLGHGDDPHIVQLRQEAHAAGSAEESAAILDKLHAYQDRQEVLRQERVAELRAKIDALTTERNEHLLADRFDQADRLGTRLDDLQRALDGSLSDGEKRAELFTELAKGIDSPEAAGHLDRIVDNGLSKAAEHAAGAGGDAERSFEDIEKLLGSLKLPDSAPHTLPGPAGAHLADTDIDVPGAGAGHGHTGGPRTGDGHFGDLRSGDAHDADLHDAGTRAGDLHSGPGEGGRTGDDAPPPRVTEPGTQELTLEAPKERAESGATTGPDLTAHPVPTALTEDDLRVLRGDHEPEVAPVRVDAHPRWDEARGSAAPKTVERSWVDPVSTPAGQGAHAPRYQVTAGFEARQFTLGEHNVTDLTVRVDLAGAEGVAAHDLDAVWERAQLGVDRVFNAPGHQLPDGDLLHVTLERADGIAGEAHLTVEVGGPKSSVDQHHWSVGATDQDLAHEIGHQLGLRDEYQAAGSEHRADISGSLMGNYHHPAPDGLAHGGMRDRYLQLIHDHIGSTDGSAHLAGAGTHGLDSGAGPAPHAPTPKASTSKATVKSTPKVSVKGGRGGSSTAEPTLSKQLSFETAPARFTGSQSFQQAVKHYEITPFVQYDGLARGAADGGGDGVRFVATVPATADVDLMKLAQKYAEGFGKDNASGLGERFGLVIGINGRVGNEAAIKEAVRDFAEKWDESGTFPVAVTGFTWRQPDPALVRQGAQKEIPYGAIRESVLRDELTSRMIEKFRPGPDSSGEIYLHVGDADVKSMTVGGTPLFDRVTTRLADFERAPEVLSGGYTLPGAAHAAAHAAGHVAEARPGRAARPGKGAKTNTAKAAQDAVKSEVAKAAAELDLKVRAAMAEVDARAVYFPEPNTFVRVDPGNGLEREIGFGEITGTGRFSYEALEGRHLVDSVVTTRGFGWADASDMVVFDPGLALVTDDERIAAEVTGEGKTLLNGLTQSHAARGTWSDQMAHYIGRYHPEVLEQTPDVLHKLTAIAFHEIEADGRALTKTSPKTPADALGGAAAWREFVKDRPVHQKLAKIAVKTRDALVDGLKKPETAAAVSPPAPAAAHGTTPAARSAGHGTSLGVSPRAPLPHTAGVTTTDLSKVADSRRAGRADLTITEVDRPDGERGPLRPTLDSPAPPPFRMTHTHQLSAADRILPSRTTAGTLTDRLIQGLDGVLTQGRREALRDGWTQELATDVWPALSAMTRGEVRTLRMDVAGWTGDVEVTAKVAGADSDGALDSLEFEDGSESFTRGGFQREKLTGLTAGVLVKGKAAEHTDLTGQLSVNWTSSQSQRVTTSGRMFTRTKTAEPALKVGADIVVQFDFSAVRDRFGARFDLARDGGERVTTLDVPLRVPVAAGAAESGVPDLAGAQHYLPPLRVEQTLALGGSDTLRDAFLVDPEGERTAGRLDTALLGDPADATSPAAFGRRTFGSDWARVRTLVLDRLGSLDVLQFELKGMTAGEAVEIDLGEGMGHLLVTAEVASMKQRRNTAKTEFNTGSDITRVFAHGNSSDLAARATMNAQSADLQAGPGSLTGTVHGQFDREGVTVRQESVRTGTAVKMKVPGVVFDGVATLCFSYRADPLGAAPRTATAPDTTASAHRTAAGTTPAPAAREEAVTPAPATRAPVTAPKEGRARIGFQVLVDAAEARPVAGAGAFTAAERPTGPRRMTATEVEAGDIAWRPSPKVWEGLPPHTVVYDVLTGEQAAAPGHAAGPALGDLVDGLGRAYFGSGWAELRPAARNMASRAQLAAALPPLTRNTGARSVPLPMPLRSDAQLALTGRLESLEYLRTLDAAEVNLLSDVTDDVANRLNSAATQGEWVQGGVQPDVTDNVTLGVHAPGAAHAKRFRSGAGTSGGTNSVASAKYAEPMVAYIARASVEATLGRPGDAAARTGRTEVRFVVAIPKSHTVSYEVAQEAAGHQVFTRPAPATAPVTPPPATAPANVTAPARPAAVTATTAEPLTFQPPERVTGGKRIGTGDVVVQLDDEAAVVTALKEEISGAFGDRWGQVEGDLTLFFDKAVMQPKTAGLTAGEHWGGSFTAGPVTADIRITAAEADMTEYLRVEKNFEFEQGTESSAAATTSKDTTSRRTLWQRFVVKAPHAAATLAHMRHSDALTGWTFDARSGVVAKNKTVEPAALFKGRLTYTVEVKISHLVPGLGSERTFTVGTGGEFAFPTRDLPIDPATGTIPRPDRSYRPPRRIQEGQALGATDIVLNVSALKPARTAEPEPAVTAPVDAAAGEHAATAARTAATRPEATAPAPAVDLTESVLRQLDAAGPKVFGSAEGWRTARAKLMDRLPASEFQRRLKPMMAGRPWTVRVNGRQVIISASVKEMRHAGNTKATEFNSAAVGVVGGGRTQEHLGGPQVVATGTSLTVVGTSDPIGATPVEVFGGGTLAHTTQVEDIAESATSTRTAVGTKSKVPGSVFDGVARLHFEFREPWRPFGKTVDKRVAPGTGDLQRRIGELRDALAEQMTTDPQGKTAPGLRRDLDQALADQTRRIRDAAQGRRAAADGTAVFAPMTRRAFGVRKRTFGDAEIGFQTLVETADAVEVADAGSARFDAPRPGTVRPRPARDAQPAVAAVSIPKPPESIWKQGMSGGQLVRDLPDMRSVRGLLDTEGRKAYAGAWDHVTSNGKRRADLVMDAFPKDRLMAGLPRMTRGGELTCEPFLINGRKAWVSAKAEVVGLTHLRDEAKAEVALATENSVQFSRRSLHSRQAYLVAQLGALAGASDAKLGAAATFGGGVRRRTRGDQASGGRVFTNAKIPTPLTHFDGHVKVTFTFHHGGGTSGQAAGVVPFGLSVPVAEITEHVTEAAGHVFLPPQPVKAAPDEAAAPEAMPVDTAKVTPVDTAGDTTADTTGTTTDPVVPAPPSAFDGVRQQHPEPIARNPRWTMWGHNGPTPQTSSYAVEFAALDLRGVYVPPPPGQGIGAWHWYVGQETDPAAVTPLTLRSPGRPTGTARAAGPPAPFVASDSARESAGAALDAAPWSGGLHWRDDTEDLYVFGPPGSEAREAVFAGGLRPSGGALVHPVTHVRPGGHPGSAWVTASRDIGWLRGQAAVEEGGADNAVLGRYGWRYDIAAPGGVDVDKTLDLAAPHPERREVLYPGGVDSRYIRGAQRLEGGRPVGPYLTNPGFVEAREPGTAETEGRQG